MSLTEQLARAAAIREGRAPEPTADRADPEIVEDAVVDLGRPAPCPSCGGPGFLERIDMSARRQHERCRSCHVEWSRPI